MFCFSDMLTQKVEKINPKQHPAAAKKRGGLHPQRFRSKKGAVSGRLRERKVFYPAALDPGRVGIILRGNDAAIATGKGEPP
jgi:hypothetical protein